MTTRKEELRKRLKEAELAYHRLMTGQSVVEFRDSNGETVRYSQSSMIRLATYIEQLKRELGLINPVRPASVWFC